MKKRSIALSLIIGVMIFLQPSVALANPNMPNGGGSPQQPRANTANLRDDATNRQIIDYACSQHQSEGAQIYNACVDNVRQRLNFCSELTDPGDSRLCRLSYIAGLNQGQNPSIDGLRQETERLRQERQEQVTAGHRCQGGVSFLGFPTWYQYLPVDADCSPGAIRYEDNDQINFGSTIGAVLLAVVEILLRVAGIVAVGFIIYGGFILMTSQGAPDNWKAGLKTLLNGLIGLAIAVFAVTAVNLFSNILTG